MRGTKVKSGHLCLTPYTAHGILLSACVSASSSILGPQTTFIWRNWEDLWTLYCKGSGKEDVYLFCLWGLHSFFPLSLEVLPGQRMNFPTKTSDGCVKEDVFFQGGSSNVSPQGNSGSKGGHIDFSNKSIFRWESLTLWSFFLENALQMAHLSAVWLLLPDTVQRQRSLKIYVPT